MQFANGSARSDLMEMKWRNLEFDFKHVNLNILAHSQWKILSKKLDIFLKYGESSVLEM